MKPADTNITVYYSKRMIPSSNTYQLSVQRIGGAARDLLKAGSEGRILAAFSRAVYLDNLNGELSWLVTENLPLHRRGIQIQGTLPRVAAGSAYRVSGQHLLLGTDIDLDLEPASTWVSPRPKPDECLPIEQLPYRLQDASCLFAEFPLPTGFGRFLLEIVEKQPGNLLPKSSYHSELGLNHARPVLNEIALACRSGDFSRTLLLGESLIGLGEGLTPSGDDFMGGLLFSNLILQELYPKARAEGPIPRPGFSRLEVEQVIKSSRKRTNLISYTILKDLVAGHAPDPLHHFINNLLCDKPLESVYENGFDLVQIGHSTGWDILTGVWLGLLLALGSRSSQSSSPNEIPSSRS
jgi:hypothetical protein